MSIDLGVEFYTSPRLCGIIDAYGIWFRRYYLACLPEKGAKTAVDIRFADDESVVVCAPVGESYTQCRGIAPYVSCERGSFVAYAYGYRWRNFGYQGYAVWYLDKFHRHFKIFLDLVV